MHNSRKCALTIEQQGDQIPVHPGHSIVLPPHQSKSVGMLLRQQRPRLKRPLQTSLEVILLGLSLDLVYWQDLPLHKVAQYLSTFRDRNLEVLGQGGEGGLVGVRAVVWAIGELDV